MRKHKINRWNWSERAKKWVYVEHRNGQRNYRYRTTTPEEFQKLVKKLDLLNEKLKNEIDLKKKKEIFKEMKKVSKQMQNMKK
jgi:hypothetical protein